MTKDTSGPAFPTTAIYDSEKGMTLRQYAAIKAMQGLLTDGLRGDDVIRNAVLYADALLAELEK